MTFEAIVMKPALPASFNSYSKTEAEFYFDGRVDDELVFYLNNNKLHTFRPGWTYEWAPQCICDAKYLNREQFDLKEVPINSENDELKISAIFQGPPNGVVIYETWIKVTTTSK